MHRRLEPALLNVHEPRGLEALPHRVPPSDREGPAHLVAAFIEELGPAVEDVLLGEGDVVRVELALHFEVLDPAAGGEVVEGFFVEGRPGGDAAVEGADVDEIEVVWGPCPVEEAVVDEEFHVGRYPGWLNRAQVGADDFRLGILIAKVDGPAARSSAQIQDALGALRNGRQEELIVHEHQEAIVDEVQALVLLFVIRGPVLRRLGILVGAAMEFAVVEDAL